MAALFLYQFIPKKDTNTPSRHLSAFADSISGGGVLPCHGILSFIICFTNSFYFALFLSYTTTPAIPANAAARIIIYINIPKLSPVETDESGVTVESGVSVVPGVSSFPGFSGVDGVISLPESFAAYTTAYGLNDSA